MDLDGLSRPVGAFFDIGAYEWRLATLTGDYNSDGVVNTIDYIVWRNTNGTTVTPYSGADGDGDGMIGGGDYSLWKANFGATAAGGALTAAVPEPGVSAYLFGVILCMANRRRRRLPKLLFMATDSTSSSIAIRPRFCRMRPLPL